MTAEIDMDDWQQHHVLQAAQQGWCLSEVGVKGSPHYLEIQRFDDAESFTQQWSVPVPQLDGDDQAVAVFKTAWLAGEDHALLAYQLLRQHSPSEFAYWQMHNWTL